MSLVIISYRDILYYNSVPEFSTIFSAFVESLAVLIVGWIVFDVLKKNFAEEL